MTGDDQSDSQTNGTTAMFHRLAIMIYIMIPIQYNQHFMPYLVCLDNEL